MLARLSPAFVVFALASLGCSDAVAPPPRASLAVSIGAVFAGDKPAGTACLSSGHSVNIGSPPPTTTDPGQRITDEEGASVSCGVSGGSPSSFSGSISQGAIGFTMSGEVAPDSVGTGNIIYTDNKLTDTLKNLAADNKPCTVSVNEGGLQVESGRIWAKFECPLLRGENPNHACRASGVFVMENCGD